MAWLMTLAFVFLTTVGALAVVHREVEFGIVAWGDGGRIMSRVTQVVIWVSLSTCAISVCGLAADEQGEFRSAWNRRLAEHASVHCEASGVKLWWTTDGNRRLAHRAELQLEVRLQTAQRKFRFDATSKDGSASLHILDQREFHTCFQSEDGGWQASSSRAIAPESDWPYLYPFLLARGVVPLPPFEVPRVPAPLSKRKPSTEPLEVRSRDTTFAFDGDSPLSVTVAHDTNGLVSSYRVTGNQGVLLEIRNTYERDGPQLRLGHFSVVKFGPDHHPVGRLDAQVTKFATDVPMAATLFIKPREPAKAREQLLALLNRNIDTKATMALGELQDAIQEALGDDLRVRIDHEAFAGRHEVKLDQLAFEAGEFTLSKFLFGDVRKNRLDFHFDAQGIVLVPRSRAWAHAESVEYSPGDYGLTNLQLQDFLYSAAKLDDWSDVGGQAKMMIDEERGKLNVFHAQSDHFHFMHLLSD